MTQPFAVITALFLLTLTGASAAPTFSILIPESSILPVTGRPDFDHAEVAVSSSGEIAFVDADELGNDRILLATFPGPVVTLVTTEDLIVAAIEAVNGTDTATDFSVDGMDFNADGDIVLVNGDNADEESVVKVTTGGAITVLHTRVDAGASGVEGATGLCCIGNIAHICRRGEFGGSDDIVSLDTDGAGAPQVTVSTIVTQATLEATLGVAAFEVDLVDLDTDGTDLIAWNSASSAANDDLVRVTTGGVASVFALATAIEAALSDTDIGGGSIAIDGDGFAWLTNTSGGAYDDGIIKVNQGVASCFAWTEGTVAADLSDTTTFFASGAMAHDATLDRLVLSNGDDGSEGIVAVSATAVPVELSVFSAG